MKTWEKILLYPIGLYLWLTDGIKIMSKKWKPAMAMLMAVVMLCGMLPTMVTAAGWSGITVLGFNYGDDGFLSITAPSTVGNYTYGTANGDTAAETAVNQSVLPESGWQWALKRESSNRYRLILNDFNITYSGNDDIMMSNTDLIIELRGSNSLVKTSSSASGSGIASNSGCTLSITGEGSLNVAGCSYAIYMHIGYTLTIESGNVNLGASYSTIYASKVELGEYVTAQSSLNSDGSNPSSFASGSRPGNYKWFQTVTNIPEYTLTFDANGGSGAMSGTTILATTRYVLPECTFTAPAGKQFKAWDIGGTEYAPGSDLKVTGNTTVTAIWENIPAAKHTVSFAANKGSGSMTPVEVEDSTEYTLPTCTFTAPSNKTFKAWSVGGEEKQPGDKITVSANTTVTAVWQDLVKYDLWVGGVQVTNTNASNITGEGITGAVSYDSTTKTLTLNNATITGAHEFSIFDDVSGIYGKETLKINLIGNNTITGSDNGGSSYGIYIDGNGNLTFTGTGSLTVSAADLSENNWSVAVFADGSITVEESCTITAYCGTNAWVASAFKSYAGSNAYNLPNATGILVAGNKNAPEATNFEVCNGDPNRFQYLRIAPGYTVTLNKDGGTINSGNVTCYFVDTGATLPTEVTKANSIFGGWYDNAECTGTAITEIPVGSTGEKEYWAKWTAAHTCSIEPVEKVWPDCENGGKEAYYKCEGCGKFFEDANGTTGIANIETWGNLPKNGHTEGTVWEKDTTHHWHICTVAGCGAVIDSSKAAHSSTGANVATCQKKAVCDDCGATYGDFAGHDWNTASWEKDATGHWHKCNTAGCTEKSDFAQHTPDRAVATETDPVKCSACGYEITAALGHTHAHGTEWKSDEDNHWNECACGDKANTAAHKDENADGKCDVCAYNVGLPTPPADPNIPQTGDNTQLGLWITLLFVSGFGLVAVVFFNKKKYV